MKMNLKRTGKVIGAIALMTIVSCQKNQDADDTGYVEDAVFSQRTSEETMMEELYTSTDCNYNWPDIVGGCAEVTESSATFPKIVTIDFGTGCEGYFGRTKKGKIIIDISDDIRNDGAKRIITFDEFYIEDVKIEGTRTATNIGESISGNVLISVVGDVQAIKDGNTWSRTFERQREWIIGSETCDRSDDEFLITGGGVTICRKGCEIQHTIITPLHVAPGSCNYILSGSVEILKEGKFMKRGGTIDWGDGACDNIATLTTFSGKVFQIDLDTKKILK
ncbi:hypothetical protein JYT72_02815 [Crocinitomix catalasitica]|nr:hypothetical protein [Crocinitomix catalasitica]